MDIPKGFLLVTNTRRLLRADSAASISNSFFGCHVVCTRKQIDHATVDRRSIFSQTIARFSRWPTTLRASRVISRRHVAKSVGRIIVACKSSCAFVENQKQTIDGMENRADFFTFFFFSPISSCARVAHPTKRNAQQQADSRPFANRDTRGDDIRVVLIRVVPPNETSLIRRQRSACSSSVRYCRTAYVHEIRSRRCILIAAGVITNESVVVIYFCLVYTISFRFLCVVGSTTCS